MQKNSRLNRCSIVATALFAAVLITFGCTQKMDHTGGTAELASPDYDGDVALAIRADR